MSFITRMMGLLIFGLLLSAGACASYVIVEIPEGNISVPYHPGYVPRIEQGDNVYLNDTVDITGVTGWPDDMGDFHLVYYGKWVTAPSPGDLEPEYVLTLPGKYRSGNLPSQYTFYVDPAIFEERPGYWYQFISNFSRLRGESSGNLRAFRVIGQYIPVFNTTSNQTEGYYESGVYHQTVIKPPSFLTERHVADYVASRGQDIEWPAGGYRLWMFGNKYGVYDVRENTITSKQMQGFETGRYTMAVHVPGNNTIFEASLENGTLIPGLYGRQPIDITGKLPPTVLLDLKSLLAGTDDSLYEYIVDLQDPYLTIEQADEVYLGGKTVLDVRGYTNVANGTGITVTLDEGKTYYKFIPIWTATTTAVRDSPGNLSQYRAYVPIDYENLAADARNHTLTARTAIGGNMQKDFKISVMPADSFKPNATLKYIEDRNPFVPTPTPIIRTVTVIQTVVKTETVVVVETPDKSDYGKVFEGGLFLLGVYAVVIVAAAIALAILIYMISVTIRARKRG